MLLVDAHGAPLSIIVTGANRHDVTQLATTLDSIVVERPEVKPYHPQNLCADAGFSGAPAHGQMVERDYHPHVRPRGAEKVRRKKGYPPRRWIVEEKQDRRKKLVNLAQGCASWTYAQWEEYCRAFDKGIAYHADSESPAAQ